MAKHKIVQFTNGVAKVSITDDFRPHLDKEDNETFFINPDLSFVKGVPPEFWTVKDGKIWPMENQQHIQKRIDVLNVQSAVPNKSDENLIEEFIDEIRALRAEASSLNTHINTVETGVFKLSNKAKEIKATLEDKIVNLDDKLLAEKEKLKSTLESRINDMAIKHDKVTKVLGILLAIALIIAIAK